MNDKDFLFTLFLSLTGTAIMASLSSATQIVFYTVSIIFVILEIKDSLKKKIKNERLQNYIGRCR